MTRTKKYFSRNVASVKKGVKVRKKKFRKLDLLTSEPSEMTSKTSTLTEVFPCFFLSCKANAGVYLAKTGHGPHSS